MLAPGVRHASTVALGLAFALPSHYALAADAKTTTIDQAVTTRSLTSKTGDLTISSTGGITVKKGAAVVVDSDNKVDNQGAISINDANNVYGIHVYGHHKGLITNEGSITLSESTPPTEPPLATGTGRYGIGVTNGFLFKGSIQNTSTGTISVLGNQSAGIAILNTGGITGAINEAGTIGVTGDHSSGILTGIGSPVLGGISITGSIAAVGQGSEAVTLYGNLGHRLYVNGSVIATGFYNGGSTTARPFSFDGLTSANTELGGPAIAVGGTVRDGIFIDSSGVVASYGSAAALQIQPVTGVHAEITAPTGTNTYGLNIAGDVEGNGIYDGISAQGLLIGGNTAGGATVNVENGVMVSGKVGATSYAANATAITVGTGATVPAIVNTGSISATVNFGADANAAVGGTATAILVNGGAVSSIQNSGVITATTASGSAYALDLAGDTKHVTVNQLASTTSTPSSITGDIRFGQEGATFNLKSGQVSGALEFGNATTNVFNITNGALYDGQMSVDGNGRLTLNVINGRLASTGTTAITLNSLKLGSKGELDFALTPGTGADATYAVVGNVNIAKGAKLGLMFDTQLTVPETFTLIDSTGSGTVVGGNLATLGNVPYFYLAHLITDPNAGTISVGVRDRTFTEAGVLGSESAYKAIFSASYVDPGIRDAFNAAGTHQAFQQVYQQMLPSYSGGLFELLANGASALAQTEAANPLEENGKRGGGWAQQIGFANEQSTGSAPGFHGGGLGFAFGYEMPLDTISAWGITVSYLRGASDDFNMGPENQEIGTIYGTGVYWRENDGQFRTDASVNVGYAAMNSTRNFSADDLNGTAVTRTASAAWSGAVAHAHVGVSYEFPLGDDYYVKPLIAGDYFMMYSGNHSERNGGDGFNLALASSTGTQGSVTGGVAVGTKLGDKFFLWRPEAMVGYKAIFGGPDNVTAHFASGGPAFTLSPASQKSGPVAHIGVHGGNKYSDIAVEAGGEDRDTYKAFDGRVVARFRF